MKRKIVGRSEAWEEQASISARGYSWRKTLITTVMLECGHTRVFRGMSGAPKATTQCARCAKGEPVRPVATLPASSGPGGIEDPIARALFDKMCVDTAAEGEKP